MKISETRKCNLNAHTSTLLILRKPSSGGVFLTGPPPVQNPTSPAMAGTAISVPALPASPAHSVPALSGDELSLARRQAAAPPALRVLRGGGEEGKPRPRHPAAASTRGGGGGTRGGGGHDGRGRVPRRLHPGRGRGGAADAPARRGPRVPPRAVEAPRAPCRPRHRLLSPRRYDPAALLFSPARSCLSP